MQVLLITGLLVAIGFFPIVWVANKVAGTKGVNLSVGCMVLATLGLVFLIPASFYLWLAFFF